MKRVLQIVLGILFLAILACTFLGYPGRFPSNQEISSVEVDGTRFRVEIANTLEKRTRGLSGRESLEEGSGMLFIFEMPGKHGIWMREMLFPIDILWIDENWSITDIAHSISPDTYPQIFYPATRAKYVLELPAGSAEKFGIDIGEVIFFDS